MTRHNVSTSFRFAATSLAAVLVLGCALAWLAWRLFDQDTALARQRAVEARELGADSAVALFQKQLARIEQDLSVVSSGRSPASVRARGEMFLHIGSGGWTCWPRAGLPFRPVKAAPPLLKNPVLEEADRLEFARNDYPGALRRLAAHDNVSDPQLRAAVLVRQARLHRKLGRWDAAAAACRRLGALGGIDAGGIPAVLAAHSGAFETWTLANNLPAAREASRQQLEALLSGDHPLSAETFSLLIEESFRQWPELRDRARPQLALAEAAQMLSESPTGPRRDIGAFLNTTWGPVLAIARPAPDGLAAYLAAGAAIQTEWLALAQPALRTLRLDIALAAPDGRVLAGAPPRSGVSVRLPRTTQLPWTVIVFPDASTAPAADSRRALLVIGLAVLFLGVAAAMWLASRAVFRELELARLKSEFVATVSHEFRTPLTAIRQLSELLVTGRVASDEDRREYYALLAAQGERLHHLVEGLLNFGRLESGKLKLRIERLDAAALARREAEEFQRQHAARGHRIDCHFASEPALVQADPDALRLSLANLLDNAVKYSPGADAVALKVTASNGHVQLAVTDSGPGVDPAERERIFEKFVRGSAGAAGAVPGTGIGLAMARELMRAQGGDIELTASSPNGSTFTLVLPKAN